MTTKMHTEDSSNGAASASDSDAQVDSRGTNRDKSDATQANPKIMASPFDPSQLVLNQDFGSTGSGKKILLTVPIRKPTRVEWFRVHPDGKWHLPSAAMLNMRDEREFYIVTPELARELVGEFTIMTVFTAINRQGVVFLWPAKVPGSDGRTDRWSLSGYEAARLAMHDWTRMSANMSLGAYDIFAAPGKLTEPEWPDVTFERLLEIGFKDKLITDFHHPVLKRLRGEI